jgi:hypothetical protein
MMAPKTTQAMGKMPCAAPKIAEVMASCTGMPYATSATTSAETSAVPADIQAALRNTPSMTNSTTMGMAATGVENARLPPMGV